MMTVERLTDRNKEDMEEGVANSKKVPVVFEVEFGRPPRAVTEFWPADAVRQVGVVATRYAGGEFTD